MNKSCNVNVAYLSMKSDAMCIPTKTTDNPESHLCKSSNQLGLSLGFITRVASRIPQVTLITINAHAIIALARVTYHQIAGSNMKTFPNSVKCELDSYCRQLVRPHLGHQCGLDPHLIAKSHTSWQASQPVTHSQ